MKRKFVTLIVVVVLAMGGFFGFRAYQQQKTSAASKFQTVTLTRGALVAIVGGTGTVRADQTALLSWQTSGQIAAVRVQEGDVVAAGTRLAELERNSLPQNVILAEADLVAAQRELERIKESSAAKAKAQLTLAQAQKALEDAQKRRDQKDFQRASQATLDGARANYILAEQALKDAEENYKGVSHLADDDPGRAAALSVLATARQNRDRALANLNWLLSKPDAVEIAQADAELEVAKANLEDAQREWERLKDGPDPEDIVAAEARVTAIEATLATAYLEAPFAGTITEVRSKPGDQVTPGTVSFRIDDLRRLLVDAQIPEVDINRVQAGQPADLTFDAIPNTVYEAKVVSVGRVASGATQSGVNFTVTLELTLPDDAVRPGMTAAVNIIVNQLEDVLLVPNRAIRFDGSRRVVYVLREGSAEPEKVEVQIGASSDLQSEVVGGDVKEGDVIVLNPPVENRGGRPFGE
ncbi:MAG: efflux RND transporter periplasmic adaptor subunit [Anaerolineae bacterium]|nr:efflux RND transporter periplasmic adaptor subunit [Anaerolineae bacterium]